MAKKKVANLVVRVLVEAGVERVYGVAGDLLNRITDIIRTGGRLQWVHMRHEEAGALAAGAEAHLVGKLAVCVGSCGPGNMHLINGLFFWLPRRDLNPCYRRESKEIQRLARGGRPPKSLLVRTSQHTYLP
jgi:glyoxylate carboligase